MIIEDGRIDEFIEKRYASYESGIGKKILNDEVTLEELEAYTLENKERPMESGRQEYLETILNQILYK